MSARPLRVGDKVMHYLDWHEPLDRHNPALHLRVVSVIDADTVQLGNWADDYVEDFATPAGELVLID